MRCWSYHLSGLLCQVCQGGPSASVRPVTMTLSSTFCVATSFCFFLQGHNTIFNGPMF